MRVMLSYPKSGRTWLRFMVDSYLCKTFGLSCANVFKAEQQLKLRHPIEWTHLTGAMIARLPYWSMGPWNFDEPTQRVPWIVLTRNFQATLASAYFQARDRIKVFQGTPGTFMRDPRYGAIKLVTFYNMLEELKPTLTDCRVFSYEAMLDNPRPYFEEVINALGLRVDPVLINEVIEEGRFENMQRLSLTPEYAGSVLAPTDPNNPQTFKVRSAGRDKKELFTDDDLAYLDRVIDDHFPHKHNPDYARCLGRPVKRKETSNTPVATEEGQAA